MSMSQVSAQHNVSQDTGRLITDDYECYKDCRNCPFPGAKCYLSKYDRYNTNLLIQQQKGANYGKENSQ